MADDMASVVIRGGDQVAAPLFCTLEPRLSRRDFLSALFRALDCDQIRYCVLHSWEELPDNLPTDLDIAIHPDDKCKLRFAFARLSETSYAPVQVFNYFVSAYYFVFVWFDGVAIRTVAVDVIFEHRRGGLIAPSGEELVADRRRRGIFWIPAPEAEFVYLLAKKTWKGEVPERQTCRLKALVEQLGKKKTQLLAGELFLGNLSQRAVEACASGRLNVLFGELSRETWKTSLRRSPLRLWRYLVADAVRRIRRWFQPTGLFIVIMGPDGAGKSTLIERLLVETRLMFRRQRIFHWRPMFLWRRKSAEDTTHPHSRSPQPAWWSMARLMAHLLDYWLGYLLIVRPLIARSGLVVFDRYFDDILVDPKRYRYGGPLWLARLLQPLIPKPNLTLVLDAPEQVVLSRKKEVAPGELRRQRRLYLGYAARNSGARIVETSGPIPQVTTVAAQKIVEYLGHRFEIKHREWLGNVGASIAPPGCEEQEQLSR